MNWGHGITIAIISFITFILSILYFNMPKSADLVVENYYEVGINFEQRIQSIRNSKGIKEKIIITITDEMLSITFPKEVIMDSIVEGLIHLYRPDNGNLDKHFPFVKTTNNVINIPLKTVKTGNYSLLMSWKTRLKDFYIDKGIVNL